MKGELSLSTGNMDSFGEAGQGSAQAVAHGGQRRMGQDKGGRGRGAEENRRKMTKEEGH
jgi:hypothetical protein